MKRLKGRIVLLFLVFVSMLGMSFRIPVSAEGFQPEGNLAEYAKEIVGTTDQGWQIASSMGNQIQDRAIGQSGVQVSKVYNGIRSYTEILTVIADDGRSSIAYCVQPNLNTPNNTDYHQQILNNERLRTVLYYGYGGNDSAEFMALEGGNVNDAYMDTWMAARQAYNGTAAPMALSDPRVQWLLNHAPAPAKRFEVGGSPQTATWNAEKMRQETGWFTTSGGGTFAINLDGSGVIAELSDGRTLSNTTSGIPTGTSFRLIAGPERSGTIQLEIPTTAKGYAGMIFVPKTDKTRQSIVSGHGGDPVNPGRIQATFTKREQKSKVIKLDLETGEQAQGDALLEGSTFGLFNETGQQLAEGVVQNGYLEFPAQLCGNYYIQEITPGEGYLVNTNQYPILLKDPGTTAVIEVKNQVKKGRIKLKKLAIVNSEQQQRPEEGAMNPLADAEFTLSLNSNPDIQYKERTDQQGEATFKDIPYGIYTLKETQTPEGFIGGAIEREVNISEDGQVLSYYFGNKDFYSDLIIQKKDAEDGRPVAIKGAQFKIFDVSENKFVTQYSAAHLFLPISEWSTDEKGKLGLDKPLKGGDYILVEVKAPEGYLRNPVDETSVEFSYEGKEYQGIPFTLNEKNCTLIEISGKSYYQYEQGFKNKPAKGRIAVEKTGEMVDGTQDRKTSYGLLTTFHFKEKPLAGAVFEIYAAEDITGVSDGVKERIYHHAGDKVAELTTREDGKAVTEDLYLGKYHVVEKSTAEGFVVDPEVHQVELTYPGEEVEAADHVVTLQVKNKRQNVNFKIKKNEEVLEGYRQENQQEVELIKKEKPAEDIVFGVFTAEKLSDGRDGWIPENRLVSIVTVEEGIASTTEDFPVGKYYYKELKTKDHLILDTQKYPIEYKAEGNSPLITIEANGGQTIVNKLYTQSFSLLKIASRNGKSLPQTKIGLYDRKSKLIAQLVTDDSGWIEIPKLPVGDYFYQELSAPQGFIKDETKYSFSIKPNGHAVNKVLRNQLAMGTLMLEKIAEDPTSIQIKEGCAAYDGFALSGAEFVVRAAKDIMTADGELRAVKGDIVAHLITDEKGKATVNEAWFRAGKVIPEREGETRVSADLVEIGRQESHEIRVEQEKMLFNGIYEVQEIKAPQGWEIDEKIYEVDLNYVDDETPVVQAEIIKPFNNLSKGQVELKKIDEETGQGIPETKVALYTQDHQKIAEGMTDDRGYLKIADLSLGTYYFKEVSAAEGYLLDEGPISFKISHNGERVTCEMKNHKKPNPATGIDGGSVFLGGCIFVVLAVMFLLKKYFKNHQHKEEI